MTDDPNGPDDFDDDLNDEALAEHALPSGGLLSFYDRLRARISDALESRNERFGPQMAELLLLAPDTFMLLARLALDRDVPKEKRAIIVSALAYFVLPADLLPEMALGAAGYVDDVFIAAVLLQHAFGRDLATFAEKHWSGRENLRVVLRDVVDSAHSVLNADIYAKVKDFLAKKGIRLDPDPA
ncbi:MAG: DUF1232 domain-containing protein [Acidobacteriota bacterium]